MIPKNPKIKDSALIARYKKDNPYCELCDLDTGEPFFYIADGLELHHILGGSNRTDEIWNIIRLCRYHHENCTHHNARGEDHDLWNFQCVKIKMGKNELKMSMIKSKDRKRLIRNLLEYEVNNESN